MTYTLSTPISSQELKVRYGAVEFYSSNADCLVLYPQVGIASQTSIATFNPGTGTAYGATSQIGQDCNSLPVGNSRKVNTLQIYTDYLATTNPSTGGWVYVSHGSSIQITSLTTLTVSIYDSYPTTCIACV